VLLLQWLGFILGTKLYYSFTEDLLMRCDLTAKASAVPLQRIR
jgi:hypothetical protein